MDRYSHAYDSRNGPGDARPTALQIVHDEQQGRGTSLTPLHELVIIITGTTSGIGFETARALYASGSRLFITARDIDKGRQAAKRIKDSFLSVQGTQHSIEVIVMELDSLSSVRSAADEILHKTDRVNVLINNAGIAAVPFGHTGNGFERHWGINYIAPFLFTYLLLPRLEASSTPTFRSRIVNVSSTGHRLFPIHLDDPNFETTAYEAFAAYGTSKLANIYHTNYIDRHFSARGLQAVSIHPGTIRETQLLRALDPVAGQQLSSSAIPGYEKELMSAEQGAATTVWAAIRSYLEGKGSLYLENCTVGTEATKNMGPVNGGYAAFAFDQQAEETLWRETCDTLDIAQGI